MVELPFCLKWREFLIHNLALWLSLIQYLSCVYHIGNEGVSRLLHLVKFLSGIADGLNGQGKAVQVKEQLYPIQKAYLKISYYYNIYVRRFANIASGKGAE